MHVSRRFTGYLGLLLLACSVIADDYLVSQRHNGIRKRYVDDNGNYNISIYHINDVHAHLDEFIAAGTDCTDSNAGCYGGYARVKHVIDSTRPTHPDSLFLNLGDECQGTLFYSFYGGEKIADTLNQLGFDAMTLGNHEFDRGDDFVGDFIQNLTFPIVCANIQTNHPIINATVVPYHIFEKHSLAVIGLTTDTIPDISSPGPNTTFQDPVAVLQATVDYIKATKKNITRFIAMTHIGYEKDIELAQKTRGVYLIVGGHSHSLLGPYKDAEGPYPTIARNLDGEEVFVVTSHRWGEHLGYIDVAYDPQGRIVAYTGGPIHLTNQTAQDKDLQKQIKEWRAPFEEYANQVVGYSKVVLDQTHCKQAECLLGDYMADALADYRPSADGAIINGGGVRATIDKGNITRGEIITAFPFRNAAVEVKFNGSTLWKSFEGIVSARSLFNGKEVVPIMQLSKEIRVSYNPALPRGSRMISLTIGGRPVDAERVYTLVTSDFLATGGDNQLPTTPASEIIPLDAIDEVLLLYINKTSPITVQLDGRVSLSGATVPINAPWGRHSGVQDNSADGWSSIYGPDQARMGNLF